MEPNIGNIDQDAKLDITNISSIGQPSSSLSSSQSICPDGYLLLEYFGAHDFGWVKTESVIPLMNIYTGQRIAPPKACHKDVVAEADSAWRWLHHPKTRLIELKPIADNDDDGTLLSSSSSSSMKALTSTDTSLDEIHFESAVSNAKSSSTSNFDPTFINDLPSIPSFDVLCQSVDIILHRSINIPPVPSSATAAASHAVVSSATSSSSMTANNNNKSKQTNNDKHKKNSNRINNNNNNNNINNSNMIDTESTNNKSSSKKTNKQIVDTVVVQNKNRHPVSINDILNCMNDSKFITSLCPMSTMRSDKTRSFKDNAITRSIAFAYWAERVKPLHFDHFLPSISHNDNNDNNDRSSCSSSNMINLTPTSHQEHKNHHHNYNYESKLSQSMELSDECKQSTVLAAAAAVVVDDDNENRHLLQATGNSHYISSDYANNNSNNYNNNNPYNMYIPANLPLSAHCFVLEAGCSTYYNGDGCSVYTRSVDTENDVFYLESRNKIKRKQILSEEIQNLESSISKLENLIIQRQSGHLITTMTASINNTDGVVTTTAITTSSSLNKTKDNDNRDIYKSNEKFYNEDIIKVSNNNRTKNVDYNDNCDLTSSSSTEVNTTNNFFNVNNNDNNNNSCDESNNKSNGDNDIHDDFDDDDAHNDNYVHNDDDDVENIKKRKLEN